MLQILKPFIYVWATLNFIDDLSVVMKIFRLVGVSTFNRREDPEKICNFCDDLMVNILRGSEGFEAVPCSWICLGTKKCTGMCRKIQEVIQTSTDFPCVAAGYCEDEDGNTNLLNEVINCKKGPLFSCEPKKFCRKRRKGFRFRYNCDLKPGFTRWVHMKKTAAIHTSALASGLISRKRCDDPDAGPYCIVQPSGSGRIAEVLGAILSLIYGGCNSIIAIETPGGDDDQQWLTFWVMYVVSMFFEQTFARVLLSKFPLYYQAKLLLIIWLIAFDGATFIYRYLRRRLRNLSFFGNILCRRNKTTSQEHLETMIKIGGQLINHQVNLFERQVKRNLEKRNYKLEATSRDYYDWEYDYTEHEKMGIVRTELDAEEKLYQISKWILSSDGMQQMENKLESNSITLLLELAAPIVSFQPKFLHIHLIGTKFGKEGRLPVMDRNGLSDCYVNFSLISEKGIDTNENSLNLLGMKRLNSKIQSVLSSIAYRTLDPVWNETLEIPIGGGELDSDGKYRNSETKHKYLLVEAWDADCGKWGIALEVFRFLIFALVFTLTSAYVTGAIDFLFYRILTQEQWQWKMLIMAFVAYVIMGLILSYMMSVVWRADDEFVGSSVVPLGILTDRREHSLLLLLRDYSMKEKNRRGILRVRLCLSEQ